MTNDSAAAAIAAIRYALEADDGLAFLRAWLHGEFPEIRRDWPDAPEEVFRGAEAFGSPLPPSCATAQSYRPGVAGAFPNLPPDVVVQHTTVADGPCDPLPECATASHARKR